MEHSSESDSSYGLRKRSVGQDIIEENLALNLVSGSRVTEGGVIRGTPSPGTTKMFTDNNGKPSSYSEFRKKQQSFEIHIEDCDEEEISGDDSDEDESRPVTPAPPQYLPDFGGNVTYKESAPETSYLKVGERDQECLTDVSEGESDNEDILDEDPVLPPDSVIKRVPS